MKYIALLVCLSMYTLLNAQDATISKLKSESSRTIKKEEDTTASTWKRMGFVSVNINQGSLKNWAAGGDKFSLAANSQFNYALYYKNGRHNWDNMFDVNFGYVQTTSLGSRKNDDRVDVLSKYGYKFTDHLFWTGLVNLRTQLFDGYTYANNLPVFSSTIFSPAYLLASAGVDYKRGNHFSAFVSPITSRWIIVADDYLSAKGMYGVDPGEHSEYEMGAFASVNYNRAIAKQVTYKSRLDLFSNYLHKPGNIDVFMTNLFSFKINDYLSATYNLDLIYDDDVKQFGDNNDSPSTQVKSLIGIGLLRRFK
jgi:hypothetical protein